MSRARNLTALEHLCLSSNQIRQEGYELVAKLVEDSSALVSLDLHGNQVWEAARGVRQRAVAPAPVGCCLSRTRTSKSNHSWV